MTGNDRCASRGTTDFPLSRERAHPSEKDERALYFRCISRLIMRSRGLRSKRDECIEGYRCARAAINLFNIEESRIDFSWIHSLARSLFSALACFGLSRRSFSRKLAKAGESFDAATCPKRVVWGLDCAHLFAPDSRATFCFFTTRACRIVKTNSARFAITR